MDKVINKIFEKIEKEPLNERLYSDCFDCIKIIFQTDKEKSFEYNGKLRQLCLKAKKESKNWDFIQTLEEIRKESYHLEAEDVFDSYLIYLEWNRPAKKKFYIPRRKQLKTLVEDLQDLADRKIDFLGISLPPRVGKSTLCIMFMTWIMGMAVITATATTGLKSLVRIWIGLEPKLKRCSLLNKLILQLIKNFTGYRSVLTQLRKTLTEWLTASRTLDLIHIWLSRVLCTKYKSVLIR